MLQHMSEHLVSLRKLGPDPGWVQVDVCKVTRSVHLMADPNIVVVILDDGHVMPVTMESAKDASLI